MYGIYLSYFQNGIRGEVGHLVRDLVDQDQDPEIVLATMEALAIALEVTTQPDNLIVVTRKHVQVGGIELIWNGIKFKYQGWPEGGQNTWARAQKRGPGLTKGARRRTTICKIFQKIK